MHFETLDPRRLMAVGFDTTFAGDGTLETGDGTNGVALSTDRGLFVVRTVNNKSAIYKYNNDGTPFTPQIFWGESGSAAVDFNVTKLVREPGTDYLYAAGVETRADGSRASLAVMRFTAAGIPDFRFGSNGVAVYSIAAPKDDPTKSTTYDASLSIDQLIPLDGRQVMVGFTRGVTATRDVAIESSSKTDGSINLMRLRYNGLRDNTFGKAGITTLLSTSQSSALSEFSVDGDFDRAAITDIEPQNGGYRVVATRQYGESSSSNGSPVVTRTTAAFQVKSRFVSTTGVDDPQQAFSWTLLKPTTTQTQQNFTALTAEAQRNDRVAVIGRYDVGKGPYGALNYIELKPGQRPAGTTPFAAVLPAATVVTHSSQGFYYLADEQGRVARFRPDLKRDIGFARRGVGDADIDSDGDFHLIADVSGDVLVIEPTKIQRLA